jgi:ATP-binding cassette subfamily F protein 3
MLTIADVSKSYGTRTLFEDVSLFIARSDRYGLVGPNGAGKTTLFNLILGEEAQDSGTIEWERGANFGFLPQESAPIGAADRDKRQEAGSRDRRRLRHRLDP